MPKPFWGWLALVLFTAVALRAGLWLSYPLAESNDTATYRHLARSLQNKGLSRYNGTRTLGYPLFVALTQTDSGLYAAQLSLGVATTLLIFCLGWQVSRRAWFAGAMGLAHTLNLGQLFYEGAVLSESLATFLLFVLLLGLAVLWKPTPPRRFAPLGIFLLSIASAALAMVRPLFLPVPFLGAFFTALLWRQKPWRQRWSLALLLLLPTLLTLGWWVAFIYARFNMLGLDSMGGYHLVNHVTSFFEYAPPQYASIRDTFLHFRALQIAESGSGVNTIWSAIPTLMEQEKLNYYALARRMGAISQTLMREHPWLYLQNVLWGWQQFWRVGVFWRIQTLPGAWQPALAALMLAERMVLWALNWLFVAGSLLLAFPGIRARLRPSLWVWFGVSAVWLISIAQTLAEHGDNARFLAPMQSLVLLLVAAQAQRWREPA